MKKIVKNVWMLCALSMALFVVSSCCGKQDKAACCAEKDTATCCAGKEIPAGALFIVAHVTVHPEAEADVTAAFQAVITGTRQEAGNIAYDLYQDVSNPLKYTFVEAWASEEAIQAHNASEHFQAFAKAIEGKADLDVSTLKQPACH